MNDRYELERFVVAQNLGSTYERAVAEMSRGHKTSHWMWFIFPQIAGLGRSSMSKRYAIASLEEAKDYLIHQLLGQRLIECSNVLLENENRSAVEIFGELDAQKLRSSMTLFARASPECEVFKKVLDRYFDGQRDSVTEDLLDRAK